MSYSDHIALHAQLEPNRPAVFWHDTWISYAQLDQRIDQFATRLLELGVESADRVSMLALNHPVHLYGLYAAARHGWLHAPLNHRLPGSELSAMLEYLGSKVLIYGSEFSEQAKQIAQTSKTNTIALEALELEMQAITPKLYPAPLSDDQIMMLLFTGGTTGIPKAAKISRRMFETNIFDTITAWGLTSQDCTVIATPMFHAGVNALAIPLLAIGGRIAILESFTPKNYLELAAAAHATIHFAVPTMFQRLVEDAAFSSHDFTEVKYAITGGSACSESVRLAFQARGVAFKLGYGMTEVGVNCFCSSLLEARENPDSVGFPMPHLEAVIRDEHGLEVAPNTVGELTLSGPQVTSGYWNMPLETAQTLQNLNGQTWLFTGDLAMRDHAGRHFIVGRRKEMFISGGENVYPNEIERALLEHPAMLECAVMGLPDQRWGEVGLAVIVLRDKQNILEHDLKTFLKERLAGYKIPKHYLFVSKLPKSAAGKILKRDLLEQFLNLEKGIDV
jgi:fatty-acyl-CoA synthase